MTATDETPESDKPENAPAETGKTGPKGAARKGAKRASSAASGKTPSAKAEAPVQTGAKDAPKGEAAGLDDDAQPAEPLKAGPSKKEAHEETAPDKVDSEKQGGDAPGAKKAAVEPRLPKPAKLENPKEEARTPPAPLPVVTPERRGGFWPLLLGGIVAGAIGFGLAWILRGMDDPMLQQQLRAQDERIAAAESRIAGMEGGASAESVSALEARLAALEEAGNAAGSEQAAAVTAQADALAALNDRVDALEKAPVEASTDPAAQAALAAYGREVDALRKEISDQMAQMNTVLDAARQSEADAALRQEEAAKEAERAAEQRALLDVQSALETGAAYAEALGRITSVDIPTGLAAHASEGVATLDDLKASYPAAARKALKASRNETASQNGGFSSWLTRQVGARSLAPKEGNDPDAVLSRAEAALNGADLSTALKEIATLPEGGQAALADWVAAVSARNEAVTGADSLSESLASN